MIYLYDTNAGNPKLTVEGEEYRHLFKARRLKISSEIYLRNLKDDYLYKYRVDFIERRRAVLSLIESIFKVVAPAKELHIGWCLIDTKTLEKFLPPLNEIGVSKITPLICDRSQRNFKIDMDRLKRILINSSQQCGRSRLLKIMPSMSIDEFVQSEKSCYMLNFSQNMIRDKRDNISTIVIGCEGGFSDRERNLFDENRIVGLNTSTVLRSETAAISAASILLL